MENNKRVVFPYANARTPTKPQGNQLSHRLSLRLSHRLSPNCPLIVPLKLRPNTPCPTEAQIVPTWNFAKNSVRWGGVGGEFGRPNCHNVVIQICIRRASECVQFGGSSVHTSGIRMCTIRALRCRKSHDTSPPKGRFEKTQRQHSPLGQCENREIGRPSNNTLNTEKVGGSLRLRSHGGHGLSLTLFTS